MMDTSYQIKFFGFLAKAGGPDAGATVTAYFPGTTSPLPGTGNPATSDSKGFFEMELSGELADIKIDGSGGIRTITNVQTGIGLSPLFAIADALAGKGVTGTCPVKISRTGNVGVIELNPTITDVGTGTAVLFGLGDLPTGLKPDDIGTVAKFGSIAPLASATPTLAWVWNGDFSIAVTAPGQYYLSLAFYLPTTPGA